ncbi:SGNH/GDSL hydrolase family protein [Actinomadura rudentiformis]|uniref:SGNH/GDSL hydrolase family protein n=1 Tax=Actinomadura rudentiformis TaxID=359158 RepID=UPI0021F4CEAE|nr:SGNH/GDSL hydrolase family protein [Actinomadura rudentiformis]
MAFGDSLTDGYGTTPHTNIRYPDELAERLLASHRRLSVLNSGIGGNLLNTDHPCWGGEAGVKRFKREVLDEPGVRTAIVFEGVNDIVTRELDMGPCGKFPVVDEHSLIKGYRTLIQAAHARGVTIIGTTLGPFKGAEYFDTVENERIRDAVNHWIRTSGEFDAVVDADKALSNPDDPDALRPAYDSGDHIHPNDAGAKAIAAAVDLKEL